MLAKLKNTIRNIFQNILPKVREKFWEVIPSVDQNLVESCLHIFNMIFWNIIETHQFSGPNFQKNEKLKNLFFNSFVFAFSWSIGGNLHDSCRVQFNELMRLFLLKITEFNLVNFGMFDFFINVQGLQTCSWSELVQEFHYSNQLPFFNILVETVDTVKLKNLLMNINMGRRGALLNGQTGTGKSVIIKDYLKNLDQHQFMQIGMNFSGQTTSKNLQDFLQEKLVQRGRDIGPPSGKKLLFFVDDINMPKLDTYGSQSVNELLRQIIDQGGYYDLKKYVFKSIKDMSLVAACGPPGGGKNHVTPRLFRHFNLIWIQELNDKSME